MMTGFLKPFQKGLPNKFCGKSTYDTFS